MYKTIEAVYKNGVIVPLEEITVNEKSRLLITVHEFPQKNKKDWLSVKGKLKGMLSSVDEFMARKQKEKKLERF